MSVLHGLSQACGLTVLGIVCWLGMHTEAAEAWLIPHDEMRFKRLTSYGLHVVQPHYANKWFAIVEPADRKKAHTAVQPQKEGPTASEGSFLYKPVRERLFTHPVEQDGERVRSDPDCRVEK